MRKRIEKIFSPADVRELTTSRGGAYGRLPLDFGGIPKVVVEMIALGAGITPESYATIERNPNGHDWHLDTGDSNHMPWCRMSASVGLTPPSEFVGGEFQFNDPFEEHRTHYLDALIYSNDQLHRVLPHEGNRIVLLIFLGEPDGE